MDWGDIEILVRKEGDTNPNFGKRPEDRNIEELLNACFVNIDKPRGPTSHQVTYWVKYILGVKKVGHAGTLDPKVTGVLPIAINRATKLLEYLQKKSVKEYIAIMHLHKDVSYEEVKNALLSFVGEIWQLPPVRSAVKRVWRKRKIYDIKVLEAEGRDILLYFKVESGVYIRKLIHDIGQYLKIGAHMTNLRRIAVDGFKEDSVVTLHDLEAAMYLWKYENDDKLLKRFLIPVEFMCKFMKKVWIFDNAVANVVLGAPLYVTGISKIEKGIERGDIVAIMSLKDELVAIGRAMMTSKEMKLKKKGMAVKTDKVILDKHLYPRGI